MNDTAYAASTEFVNWVEERVLKRARGTDAWVSAERPDGRFWLGQLVPEDRVLNSDFGDRSERITPCAMGIKLRPCEQERWSFEVRAQAAAWRKPPEEEWIKSEPQRQSRSIYIPADEDGPWTFPLESLSTALDHDDKDQFYKVDIDVTKELDRYGYPELTIQVVNRTPDDRGAACDPQIYEVELEVIGLETIPFLLEGLPESFRYDRKVAARGINGGVQTIPGLGYRTTDCITVDRARPRFWTSNKKTPELDFETLSRIPLIPLQELVDAHEAWGKVHWSKEALDARSAEEGWSREMLAAANQASETFQLESQRMRTGLELLESNQDLRTAYRLMNEAMIHAANGKYDGWRPFQVGFQLATLESLISDAADRDIVDILWFSTGGGKTETYLGLLVMAALFDRMRGKASGITAWSRFPLRLLSLQQTQRFAEAMAGAEIVRRAHKLGGAPMSLGFFVGSANTPNRIKVEPEEGEPDPYNPETLSRYKVLTDCPFCHGNVEIEFDHETWRLGHACKNEACAWPSQYLPFYIVDEEIYRFLPTILVGTLDKAASIGIQAAMRGMVGAPHGLCSGRGHGYVYAKRSKRPNGCLVPGCQGSKESLPQDASLYAPTIRLQDELHLLRDSLGAVDAHYESLLDGLQLTLTGTRAKIVASSATLTGFQRQCRALYARDGRVFPLQGTRADDSFWTGPTDELLRRYVALAPRGVTLEFAADRLMTEMQSAVRELLRDPESVCKEIGLDPKHAGCLIDLYGTNVVYGNTIRDLEAATRSVQTQIHVGGAVNQATLTGSTPFEDVRAALDRLEDPEAEFTDRIHVVAASAMMSHGVDIDRLNTMVMLGQPLTTAEFMQTTARIGRKWPGLVFVLHKIARERDAGLYRDFRPFVVQGDRFVDAVPITRRSRRVLERTLPGLMNARLLMLHEARSDRALTLIKTLRDFHRQGHFDERVEYDDLVALLGFGGSLDEGLRVTIHEFLREYFGSLVTPTGPMKFPSDLTEASPMRSLRDVEEQAPVHD